MALTYLTGNDGNVTFGDHFAALFNTWSGTVSRVSTDITGFADAGKRRRLGVIDFTGSAGGHMSYGVTDTDPGLTTMEALNFSDGAAATFTVAAGCTIVADVVISSVAISSDKNGDATVAFNFEMSGGVVPNATWAES